MAVAGVLIAATLSGCVTSGSKSLKGTLTEIPSDLRLCFDRTVKAPPKGPLSKAQVMNLVAELKVSETEKVACGKRLIAFYDNLNK